eukprot:gene9168-16300_t
MNFTAPRTIKSAAARSGRLTSVKVQSSMRKSILITGGSGDSVGMSTLWSY